MNEERKKSLQSLKTAKGQIDGIIKMIEEDRYCIDISNQIFAAQSLLKKANLIILENHLSHCVKDACISGDGDEKINEIMKILDKAHNLLKNKKREIKDNLFNKISTLNDEDLYKLDASIREMYDILIKLKK